MSKQVRIIIPILIAIIVIFIIVKASDEGGDPTKLVLSGNIEVTDARLGFKIPGRLAERLANEGETIAAGDLVAVLEDTDGQLAVNQAQANVAYVEAILSELEAGSRQEDIDRVAAQLQQSRAKLDELQTGSRAQEIANAEAQLDLALAGSKAALSQLALAKSDIERYEELFEAGVVSESEYERMQTQHETAEGAFNQSRAAVKSAEEALSLVREGPRTEQLNYARAAVNQAEAAYRLVKSGPREETIEQATAQVNIAKEALKQAKQQLEYTRLYAPFDGVVLSKAAEQGEYLNPGSPVVTIGSLDKVWLRAYINETDLSRVSLGTKVDVTTDTYPDKVYMGSISFISSEAEFTPKSVQTQDERVKLMYLVKIELDNPNYELKPGMPADCIIHIGE